ncbi:MAG: hypothetical protein ABJB34_03700, partial [Acidobacteriota bacterium]
FYGLNLNATDYTGEKFSFDGSKTKVAKSSGSGRSFLGLFVDGNETVLRDSLLGGVLLSSWALNDIANKNVRLAGGGIKKIDGKEYYTLNYLRKSGSDFDVTLYFEKDTFRHARTEYRRTSSAGIGVRPEDSSRLNETRVKVTELYGDFRVEKQLTLPHTYKLIYAETGQSVLREVEWAYKLNEFAFNRAMDDNTFDADAK